MLLKFNHLVKEKLEKSKQYVLVACSLRGKSLHVNLDFFLSVRSNIIAIKQQKKRDAQKVLEESMVPPRIPSTLLEECFCCAQRGVLIPVPLLQMNEIAIEKQRAEQLERAIEVTNRHS